MTQAKHDSNSLQGKIANHFLRFFLLPLFLYYTFSFAAEVREYRAMKATPHPPEIDGKLNEPCWKKAPAAGRFIQQKPFEGRKPSQPTTFKIIYDNHNLYVGIRAYDDHPEAIVSRVAKRDAGTDADRAGILIDSFFDGRTAFYFSANAAGVRRDGIFSEDGRNRDYNWDPVWHVQTAIDDSGWTAEMRIPFSQLRFANAGKDQVWGLEVFRDLFREQERSLWQPIPQNAPGTVHLYGHLRGINFLPDQDRLELLPYTVGKVHKFRPEPGNPFADGQSNSLTGGLDGKYRLTSDITADFTVHPDFGQVEADPSVVNLTAFETFFAEKRPFFIEGKNIFSYSLGRGFGGASREGLFYSRRVGRRPHHTPETAANEYSDQPKQTDIITAIKATGKTRSGISLGILEAVTAREYADIDSAGLRSREEVEPLTNYLIGRVQKDFSQGNTIIGGIFTAVNRKIDVPQFNELTRAAYTGGVDFLHRWSNKNYSLGIKTAFSHVRGKTDAITTLQRRSARYYQRPDANYLTLDSSRTSLSGNAGFINFSKEGGGHWQFSTGLFWRSPGFEANDIGFLRTADLVQQFNRLEYVEWRPTSIFRNFNINANFDNRWNWGGEKLLTNGNITVNGRFRNNWRFRLGVNRDSPKLDLRALRGGPALDTPPVWNLWFNFGSDSRQVISFGLDGFNRWRDDKFSRTHNIGVSLEARPTDALFLKVEPNFNFVREDLQYVTTLETDSGDRYVMGRLNQRTLGIQTRINYSITPNLTIQLYAQPFISAGKYTQLKRITRPRARKYRERFHQYDAGEIKLDLEQNEYSVDENLDGQPDYTFSNPNFNFREFNSNLVLRWEYQPGSTLFLVWSQGRSQTVDKGSFAVGGDFRGLFRVFPENVFLIKFNHWFSM